MISSSNKGRGLLLTAVVVALATGSGCSWFRGKTGYELSPEARPLEIPPDLNAPPTGGALALPVVATPRQAAAPSQAFTLADTAAGAYERVGIALSRIEGVSVQESAKLLTLYTVEYEGEKVLIRIAPQGDAARVAAVSEDGREVTAGAGAKLLGLLRERLG